MNEPDEDFERYLRGDSDLSNAYRRGARLTPPRLLDRRVFAMVHKPRRRRTRHDVFSYAACALLAIVVLFAIEAGPHHASRPSNDAPRFLPTAVRSAGQSRPEEPAKLGMPTIPQILPELRRHARRTLGCAARAANHTPSSRHLGYHSALCARSI